MDDFAYPRPQLQRPRWQCLNGEWEFAFDHELAFHEPSDPIPWGLSIRVPFAPEAPASGIGDQGFHRACWYRLDFDLEFQSERTMLHFGAVDYRATVWVNGLRVARHEGGSTPF